LDRYSQIGEDWWEAEINCHNNSQSAIGKDNISICGYHGWIDWSLAANLGENEHPSGQHLPGLSPASVSQGLRETVSPFNLNI